MDIGEEIRTAFDVASLLLVFVTLLFGLRYGQVQAAVQEPARAGAFKLNQQIVDLRSLARAQVMPLLVLTVGATWMLFPLALRTMAQSQLALWHFDVARTGFVALVLLMAILAGWSAVLLWRINVRVRALKRRQAATN